MDGHQTGFPHYTDAPIGASLRDEQGGQRWQYPYYVSDTVHPPQSGATGEEVPVHHQGPDPYLRPTAYFGNHGPTYPINSTVVDFNIPPYHPFPPHEMPGKFQDTRLTMTQSSSTLHSTAFPYDPYHTLQHSSSSHGSQPGSVPVYPIGFEDEAIATPTVCSPILSPHDCSSCQCRSCLITSESDPP
jgi:hypothetical protein